MDTQSMATREDLNHVQMDVKHVQAVQVNHADRILRLERRQADDAALKSVWGSGSPFPAVLGGTPQQGPVPNTAVDVFDDFEDEQSQNLLGSLQLDADEEPARRGASRANSVRFDVSALQGSNWATGSRHSGEFAPIRPNSGFGSHPMTERSLSYRSDGRHSSAGHSVHSVHSIASAPSGRASSLGLDTNFLIGDSNDDSLPDTPDPPPGLFVLGSVPSIIRCWLTTSFSHNALIYAAICTGSQRSTLDFSLIKELGLETLISTDNSGQQIIRLPVYLPEAVITQPTSRSNSPAPQLPTLTVEFVVMGLNSTKDRNGIRIFLGCDALRAHNADVLFSRNLMTLYGDDRSKLSVPFVRPEDENMFKYLCTTSMPLETVVEPRASFLPFTPPDARTSPDQVTDAISAQIKTTEHHLHSMPISKPDDRGPVDHLRLSDASRRENKSVASSKSGIPNESLDGEDRPGVEPRSQSGPGPREAANGIWGSWRNGSNTGSNENELMSGYQRAVRGGGRNMKVLKPSASKPPPANQGAAARSSSFSNKIMTASEPLPAQKTFSEGRRKSQAENAPLRTESSRGVSEDSKGPKTAAPVPRSSNPIGGASAFSWMTSKTASTRE